uniref:Ovule protein n=1 Tax=Romanomermis culicivorax TaxID=13658 RepID=A0A915HZX8_ROMCU
MLKSVYTFYCSIFPTMFNLSFLSLFKDHSNKLEDTEKCLEDRLMSRNSFQHFSPYIAFVTMNEMGAMSH